MKKIMGFTLIELVIVILVLGILAAYAAPKFLKVDTEARKAAMRSLKASIQSSSEMVHAMAITQGKNGKVDETVEDKGIIISIKNGYAKAEKEGIVKVVDYDTKQINDPICNGIECVWTAKVRKPNLCSVTYVLDYDIDRMAIFSENLKECDN